MIKIKTRKLNEAVVKAIAELSDSDFEALSMRMYESVDCVRDFVSDHEDEFQEFIKYDDTLDSDQLLDKQISFCERNDDDYIKHSYEFLRSKK